MLVDHFAAQLLRLLDLSRWRRCFQLKPSEFEKLFCVLVGIEDAEDDEEINHADRFN